MSTTFTIGEIVAARSACDSDCIFRFMVIARTAKFITVADGYDTRRVGIAIDSDGNEYAYPLGRYSMAPIIRAGVDLA